jgi:hypothetical protein
MSAEHQPSPADMGLSDRDTAMANQSEQGKTTQKASNDSETSLDQLDSRSELHELKEAQDDLLPSDPELRKELASLDKDLANADNESALERFQEKLREFRLKCALEYIQDTVNHFVDHYENRFAEAENGEEAKVLLELQIRNALKEGVGEFVETGDMESIEPVGTVVKSAVYEKDGVDKRFITDIEIIPQHAWNERYGEAEEQDS